MMSANRYVDGDEYSASASQGRDECPRCGDPVGADGTCDCEGDTDRDYVTAHADLKAHPVLVYVSSRGWDGELDEGGGDIAEVWL